MCEPYHSTVQFPVNDGEETFVRALCETPNPTSIILPEAGMKVGSFINYAIAGGGHSEAIRKMGRTAKHQHLLSKRNDFETEWWIRKVKHDVYRGQDFDKADAFEAAEIYAQRKVIGDLRLFRQWFERALRNTDNQYMYVEQFLNGMLTFEGREDVVKKLNNALYGKNKGISYLNYRSCDIETLLKVLLGATRKRKILVPEWADDSSIWVPSK